LKQDLGALIDALPLSDLQRRLLCARWLDQVVWMEGRADAARGRYYVLRLSAIIGGVIIPALVGLDVSGRSDSVFRWIAFVLGLIVAIAVAVEEFFRYGERWRHYRRTVEVLKAEGWQFFQLSGPYAGLQDHARAYPMFAERVEAMVRHDVEVYITQVASEKKETKEQRAPQAGDTSGGVARE
jgi:hypothetical protein